MITKFNFKDKTIKSYAIRKLTPFECFRLMGVRDDVIRTMQSTNAQAAERVAGYRVRERQKIWQYQPVSNTSRQVTPSW